MNSPSFAIDEWETVVERLGGRERLEKEGRDIGAFERAREVTCAVDLLRFALGYCLGSLGLRLTAAWLEALGLASLSTVALWKRVRKCSSWLEILVARQLGARSPDQPVIAAAHGRLVRLVDGTTVPKKGLKEQANGELWRVRAALDLPTERFSAFELTDEKVAEQFDRAAVVKGEIRIGDRYYLQPERIANVLAAGGDIIVRARLDRHAVRAHDRSPVRAAGEPTMTTTTHARRPVSAIDPFSMAFFADPYPRHEELREAGPVVWLDRKSVV